jgi:hypothetical protein
MVTPCIPQSAIHNPKSTFRNPKSTFRNQLSFLGRRFLVLSAGCSLKNANKAVTSNSVTAGSAVNSLILSVISTGI